jgi:hypothetical protein
MKGLFFLIAALISVSSFSQTELPKDEAGKVTFSDVVTVDSASASQLYSRAQLSIASLFKSAKDVIQLKDDAAKQIVAKGIFENYGYMRFSITLQCKDGRYKYILTDFVHESDPRYKYSTSGGNIENEKPAAGTFLFSMAAWRKVKEKTKKEVDAIIARIKKDMLSATASNSDNW